MNIKKIDKAKEKANKPRSNGLKLIGVGLFELILRDSMLYKEHQHTQANGFWNCLHPVLESDYSTFY